jgi:hypothetical protein
VGGPDQQAVVTGDGKSVYFAHPTGACSGVIRTGPISGVSAPVTAISMPNTLAIEPSPSPTTGDLAWVGVSCGHNGTTSTLYVSDQATGAHVSLGPFTGSNGDDGIAWSRDGKDLAVEDGPTVEVVGLSQTAPGAATRMKAPEGCTLSDPAFVSTQNQVAVIRNCEDTLGNATSSDVLVFDVATGQPVARIAAAPGGGRFQSLSLDGSGGHVLVGVSDGNGVVTAQVEHGRLVTVSTTSPSAAQW